MFSKDFFLRVSNSSYGEGLFSQCFDRNSNFENELMHKWLLHYSSPSQYFYIMHFSFFLQELERYRRLSERRAQKSQGGFDVHG